MVRGHEALVKHVGFGVVVTRALCSGGRDRCAFSAVFSEENRFPSSLPERTDTCRLAVTAGLV